jgi:hypothetical protein
MAGVACVTHVAAPFGSQPLGCAPATFCDGAWIWFTDM